MNNLLELALAQIKADKKKSAVLGVLTLVLLGICARMAFRGGPAPAEAAGAAAVAPAPAAAATPTGNPLPNSPPAGAAAAPGQASPANAATAGQTAAAPTALRAEAISTAGYSRQLARDLFETNWSAFRPTPELAEELGRRNAPRPEPPSSFRTFWRQMLLRAAEQRREEDLRRREVTKQADDLKLQGILAGDSPKAYVDGHWVAPGEFIGGFRVVRISAQEVELLKSGVHVRLTMP